MAFPESCIDGGLLNSNFSNLMIPGRILTVVWDRCNEAYRMVAGSKPPHCRSSRG